MAISYVDIGHFYHLQSVRVTHGSVSLVLV